MRRGTRLFLSFFVILAIGALSVAFTPPYHCTQRQVLQSLLKPGTLEIWNTGFHRIPINSHFNPRHYLSTIPHGKPLFIGADLDPRSLSMGQDSHTGYYFINFTMKGTAASRLTRFTSTHIGSYITVTLNRVVVSSPMIQYSLPGRGQFQMSPHAIALLEVKCTHT